MAKFTKGTKGGPGRPVGSKTKSYLDLNIWFEMLHADLAGLEAEKRLNYIMQAIDRLISKVQTLPGTPGDSVDNAMKAFTLINGLGNVPVPPEPDDNLAH